MPSIPSPVTAPALSAIEAPRFPWPYLLWFGVLLVVCYAPVLDNITHQWHASDDMGHGLFVPLIAGYIVWERREELLAQPVRRSRWGLLLIAWGAAQACLGALGAEIFVQRAAFMISLYGVTWYFAGTRVVRILAFPLLLLWFMIPIPGIIYKQVTFPLQLLASRLAEVGLEVLGYTVLREGNILELAGQQISVVEACDGIRALFSLSFFSLAYAYFFHPKVWMRWVMLVATIPVAVIANCSRVVLTGIVGEHDVKLAQGFLHGFSGWIIFVVAIGMLMVIHKVVSLCFRR